jgi:choline transport protein
VANWVLLVWTVFTLVMCSFLSVMPVRAGNMNYVCVVYFVVTGVVVGYWWVEGRRKYREREERTVVVDEVLR